METHVILFLLLLMNINRISSTTAFRYKRDAAGALSILTNNAQPIHADVKPENSGVTITDPPCPKNKNVPSHIENGVVFQVTAPKDAVYETKSLRKSFIQPSKIELARSIVRVVTLTVLMFTAAVEFYPLLYNVYKIMQAFMYYQ